MSEILERRLTSLEKVQEMQTEKIEHMEQDIKDIVKLLSARPTWLIFFILTSMTTVTSSLIVYVVTSHH